MTGRTRSLRLRLVKVIFLVLVLSVVGLADQAERTLRPQFGQFKYAGSTKQPTILTLKEIGPIARPESDIVGRDQQEYAGNGSRIFVETIRFRQDAIAYEFLSLVAAAYRTPIAASYGTAGFARDNEILFFRGPFFVRLVNVKGDAASLAALATEVSNSLDKGEADIPVLLKHLPNSEEAQKNAIFLHSFADLNKLGLQQGVLSAIQSQGGNADAALALYGSSKMLIIEFNTPQLAKENDDRIIARIQELWKLGEPAPTAYRRVGNYSVLVFDAPDEQTAKQLIDEVKYEQVVQWLGENPNILKEAQRQYVNTTLGVLVAVLKASGYALVACLGIGALAGALLFTRRRAQQSEAAFSDAGGMLRLNLDDLTPETNPGRLLQDRN